MFDRTELREREVLPRLRRVTEPGVVRHVHEQLGIRVRNGAIGEPGKNVLVADEDADFVLGACTIIGIGSSEVPGEKRPLWGDHLYRMGKESPSGRYSPKARRNCLS